MMSLLQIRDNLLRTHISAVQQVQDAIASELYELARQDHQLELAWMCGRAAYRTEANRPVVTTPEEALNPGD
jgi:hypothetical protein